MYREVLFKTYVAQEVSKGQSTVTGEGEHLPRCGGDIADAGAEIEQNDDARHDGGASMRLSSIVECPDEREKVRWLECEIEWSDGVGLQGSPLSQLFRSTDGQSG